MQLASRREKHCVVQEAPSRRFMKSIHPMWPKSKRRRRGRGGVEGVPRFEWRVNCAAVIWLNIGCKVTQNPRSSQMCARLS